MISSQGSNQGIAANIATTGMPEKKIVSINYSGDTCMQAAPLKRASRPKDMQLYDEPSDDGIIIRKDKMTRWHEPPSEQKASFFPFPQHNLFYPLSEILLCKDRDGDGWTTTAKRGPCRRREPKRIQWIFLEANFQFTNTGDENKPS